MQHGEYPADNATPCHRTGYERHKNNNHVRFPDTSREREKQETKLRKRFKEEKKERNKYNTHAHKYDINTCWTR